MIKALRGTKFHAPLKIKNLNQLVGGIVSNGNIAGEGWLLVAETVEFIESDVKNIVYVQPFACLPSHVIARGVIKEIKSRFKSVNIVPIDYDPGISEVNQLNRLKLMLANAFKNAEVEEYARVKVFGKK